MTKPETEKLPTLLESLLELVPPPAMAHHKMDEAERREIDRVNRFRDRVISNIRTYAAILGEPAVATPAPAPCSTEKQVTPDRAAEALTLLDGFSANPSSEWNHYVETLEDFIDQSRATPAPAPAPFETRHDYCADHGERWPCSKCCPECCSVCPKEATPDAAPDAVLAVAERRRVVHILGRILNDSERGRVTGLGDSCEDALNRAIELLRPDDAHARSAGGEGRDE